MGLQDDFPEDPTRPDIRWACKSGQPLVIPADGEVLTPLGSGFGGKNSALNTYQASTFPKFLLRLSRGSVTIASNGSDSQSASHMTASVEGHVGNAVLGGSGRAAYNDAANALERCAAASARFSFTTGVIQLADDPPLSAEAIKLLQSDPSGESFTQGYGSHYVGGWILGGTNASLLKGAASSSDSRSEIQAEYSVKVLFMESEKKHYSETSQQAQYSGELQFNGFDSLNLYRRPARPLTPSRT